MNPIALIRLEAARIAGGDVDKAKAIEQFVRRGIRKADLGGGCGCGPRADSAEAQRKRQALLHEDARALLGCKLEPMQLVQLLTDFDLTFPQRDADQIDAKLAKYGLRRNISGDDVNNWVLHGRLPGARGRAFVPQ